MLLNGDSKLANNLKFDTMELGDLLCKISELRSRKGQLRSSYLEKAIVESKCLWSTLKKMPIDISYPELFCDYEDLPLYLTGVDEEDTIVTRWRLELGK